MGEVLLKLFFAGLSVFTLIYLGGGPSYSYERPIYNRPHLLMDAQSGEILSEQLSFLRWAPASLTKMMTAYTIFRAIEMQQVSLRSPVTISEEAFDQAPTRIGFPVGSILTIENALKIILVKSANDVSFALSERIGGTEEAFVRLMNAHARHLGMVDSFFINPHGLPAEGQYTTARDMALLAFKITHEFPQYRQFFNIPALRYKRWRMRNHNALIERFEGTNGMKTGYVCASGFNIVARTKRENRELIVVLLGGKSSKKRNIETAKLLVEGFAGEFPKTDETLKTLKRPEGVSLEMHDITVDMCPQQYIAKVIPTPRPKDAPKAETIKTGANNSDGQIVIATASETVSVAPKDDKDIPEDEPPTLAELFDIYLSPRKKVGEDHVIELGIPEIKQAQGNIVAEKVIESGKIPVPTKKPTLD